MSTCNNRRSALCPTGKSITMLSAQVWRTLPLWGSTTPPAGGEDSPTQPTQFTWEQHSYDICSVESSWVTYYDSHTRTTCGPLYITPTFPPCCMQVPGSRPERGLAVSEGGECYRGRSAACPPTPWERPEASRYWQRTLSAGRDGNINVFWSRK